jgi:hypothetical protein
MQKYIYGDVLLYAREHTIKEIKENERMGNVYNLLLGFILSCINSLF